MCEDGNSAQEVGWTLALGNQKPQEHTQSRRALLGCCPSAGSTLLQYELSEAMSIQLTRVLAKASDRLWNRYAVVITSLIRRAALIAHPCKERPQQFGHSRSWFDGDSMSIPTL